jgi:DNA-binding beta-propeller fold protein YncE
MKHLWLLLFPGLLSAQVASYNLSTATIVAGFAAGSASVQLVVSPPTAAWAAVANATWLHLSPSSTSGTGSALVQFSYDANPNPGVQTGTLTIAGLTLTVTQAGTSFVPSSALVTLISQGLNLPYSVAIDNGGNLYIADTGHNAIEEWVAATGQMTTLVSTGLNSPHGVAVDSQGNVYIADAYNNAIKQWSPATQQVTTLVSSGLNFPLGVAVDAQSDVYIADFGNNAVEQWNPSTQQFTTLVGSGLSNPTGVAVDALGNVYIADFRNNAIKQWSPTTQQVIALVPQGLSFPNAVTLDGQGNVYLADGNNNALKEWSAASQAVTTLVSSGINGSFGIATDGQGNFYIANTSTSSILKFSSGYVGLGATNMNEGPQAGTDSVPVQVLGAAGPLTASSDQSWLTITSTTGGVAGFAFQANTSAASRIAHITVLGQQVTVTQSGDVPGTLTKSAGDGQSTPAGQAFPALLQATLTDANGIPIQGASVAFNIVPGANGAGGSFSASPPMPVLTDQNGNADAPVLTANSISGPFTVVASVNSLTVTFSLTNIGYQLASGSAVVGSAAGNGTALLVTTGPWTASSNASWLQIGSGSTSGAGSAVIQFSYSANTNTSAQTGTLTIGGLTFTVTQAGTSYVPATLVTPLISSGLNVPGGVAVDGQGNVYIADTGNNAIKEWTPSTQQTVVLASGLNNPKAVAVDGHGNVYIANTGNNTIQEAGTASSTLVSGLSSPSGVAVDGQGNVYFSNTGNNAIGEWSALTQQTTTLASQGLSNPTGVAVDALGNVYFADSGNNAVKEWLVASGQVNALVPSGLNNPTGVAVDGQGNVYLADTGNNAIKEWNAGSGQVAALLSVGLNSPAGVAVDAYGNVYVADTNDNAIKEITPAWLALSSTSLSEPSFASTGSVTAQVLPASIPITAVSDQSWLTITGIASGVIGFSFQANTSGANRIAHITILGLQVTVTQSGDAVANLTKCAGDGQSAPLGQPYATALQVCVADSGGNPMSGVPVSFSISVGSTGAGGTFGASPPLPAQTTPAGVATAPVLTANTVGGTFNVTASAGTLNVTFTLTNLVYTLGASSVTVGNIAGAGSVLLVAAGPWTASSSAAWLQLSAGSTGGAGNALIQFSYGANLNSSAQTGTLTISGLTFTVTQAGASYTPMDPVNSLVASGLKLPHGVAVDGPGNVYIADTTGNAVMKWNVSTHKVSTLVSSGLNSPSGVAVDAQGNVYIADNKNNAIKKWSVANGQVTSLVGTGLSLPTGVAVDSQGNVYLSDTGHNQIKEWAAANEQVGTLVSGLNAPKGVAVDAQGNVYFADSKNNAIKKWSGTGNPVATLISSGLNGPSGVAVDGDGNVYIADTGNNAIKEWSPVGTSVATLVSTGLNAPADVAVNGQANIYIADSGNNAVKTLTPVYLYLGASSRIERALAGTDSISVQLLPASTTLTASSNASWLTITSTASGAIDFSFTANTSANNRSAQISVLGQPAITITQNGDGPTTITKSAGTNQSAAEGHAFATALKVKLMDANGNAVQNVAVTFKAVAGAKGADGTFSSSASVMTNAGGYATASTLTANSKAGTFTVTATAGTLTTSFTLTITAP